MATKYLPEIIYTLALTSLSTHLLWLRKEAEEQRTHDTTRIKLLEDTVQRLRAGADVPQSDFDLIHRLAKEPGTDHAAARGVVATEHIGWREVLLGRRTTNTAQSDKWDAHDGEESQYRVCVFLEATTNGLHDWAVVKKEFERSS
jgi:hypothetical protein